MIVTAIVLLGCVVLVLGGLVYDLRARMQEFENQSDADLRVAAWEARIRQTEERVLDTAVRCESRAMERAWQATEGRQS